MTNFKLGDTVSYNAIDRSASKDNGVIGKIIGGPYGNVKVLWEDGETGFHSPEYITLIGHDNPDHSDSPSAFAKQEGGAHYKEMPIQPIQYIMENGIPFAEGCAIKYLSRWRSKGGVEDLRKARHFIDMLIEHEEKANG